MKADYLDLMLKRVEETLKEYLEDVEEMIEAKSRGEEAYVQQYIKQVSPKIYHYESLLDDVFNDARKENILKVRHRMSMGRVRDLYYKFENIAKENGFKLGLIESIR